MNMILKYEDGTWSDMDLSSAFYVAAGAPHEIYAVAHPRKQGDDTIWRFTGSGWVAFPGRAGEEIAVA
jgi:hypothetical protein